jgi:hypothetical protein
MNTQVINDIGLPRRTNDELIHLPLDEPGRPGVKGVGEAWVLSCFVRTKTR